MSNVGLLYVGAVLFLNGLMLLEVVTARSAAVFNLLVGTLQVVLPTVVLAQAHGDTTVILGASGIYLFGFTYLYVGIVNLTGLPAEGIGWFSAFVAGAAVVYSGLSFGKLHDPLFGVIWLAWALMWLLFFLVLGLGLTRLGRFTGWTVVLLSQPTCSVPALLALSGTYRSDATTAGIGAGIGVVGLLAAWYLAAHVPRPRTAPVAIAAETIPA